MCYLQVRLDPSLGKYAGHSCGGTCARYMCFLDTIASPSTYPCQSVGEWVCESFIVSDLEIAIASQSFASFFTILGRDFSKRVVFWDPTLKKTPTHNCTLAHCNHTLCSVLHQVSFFQSAHGRRCVLHRPTKTHAVDIFSANFFWKISSAEALYRFFRDWGSWSIPQGVEHAGTRLSSFQLYKSKKILLSIKGLLVAMKKNKTVKWNNKASSCTKVAVRQIGFRKPGGSCSEPGHRRLPLQKHMAKARVAKVT